MIFLERLNLCDLYYSLDENKIKEIILMVEKKFQSQIKYLYFGSYFCPNYFLTLSNELLDKFNDYIIYLVIPICSENTLDSVKKKINFLHANYYVVNDFGMLNYLKNKKMILGRLFFKDVREPRIKDHKFGFTITNEIKRLINDYKIVEVESEALSHFPYKNISSCHICEYASISKEINKKFRANDTCKIDCSRAFIEYDNYLKLGKGIYYLDDLDIKNGIYFPVGEYYEYFSTH